MTVEVDPRTRIAELERALHEREAELAEARALLEIVYVHNPDGVSIVSADGSLRMHAAAESILNQGVTDGGPESWSERYGLFHADRTTRFAVEDLPLAQAMKGIESADVLMWSSSEARPEGAWMTVRAKPLPGGGGVAIVRDVTERRRLEEDLEIRNRELAAREEENRDLIARLRVAVDELSTPVLEVWQDVLALPVVGVVDTQRSAQMSERLLAEVVRTRSRFAILDLTGVDLIDTSTADRFLKMARSVQLLGARCVITGIQPAVAQTLVELGVEFGVLDTHRNLKSALESCIRRMAREQGEGRGRAAGSGT